MQDDLLVAIDGSVHSSQIVDVGIEIAKGMALKILLVHVMKDFLDEPEGLRAYEKAEEYRDAYADYIQEIGEQTVEKYTHKIEQAGVPFRSDTPTGNPVEEILEIARLENVRMIVLGMKGRHGLAHIVSLGSVARRVVENSPCPVVVVPAASGK